MVCIMRQDRQRVRQPDDRSGRQVAVSTGTPQSRECFRGHVLRLYNSAHERRWRGYPGAQCSFEITAQFLFSPNTEKKSPFECDLLLRQFSNKPVFNHVYLSVVEGITTKHGVDRKIYVGKCVTQNWGSLWNFESRRLRLRKPFYKMCHICFLLQHFGISSEPTSSFLSNDVTEKRVLCCLIAFRNRSKNITS